VRIAGVKVGDHTPPSLPGHVANFKRGWSVSEKPDCTECSPAWDRSNNFKGVIFCTKHDALTSENADLKKRVDEVDVMRECRNTALKLVHDVTAERDQLKAENADLKKRVERYEAVLKKLVDHANLKHIYKSPAEIADSILDKFEAAISKQI
jgi:hypothetical protein